MIGVNELGTSSQPFRWAGAASGEGMFLPTHKTLLILLEWATVSNVGVPNVQ
jgi:hypothetical protein